MKRMVPAAIVAGAAALVIVVFAAFLIFADKKAERMIDSAAAAAKLQSGDADARFEHVEYLRAGEGDGYVCGNYRPSKPSFGHPRRFIFIDGAVEFFGNNYKSDRQIIELCNRR